MIRKTPRQLNERSFKYLLYTGMHTHWRRNTSRPIFPRIQCKPSRASSHLTFPVCSTAKGLNGRIDLISVLDPQFAVYSDLPPSTRGSVKARSTYAWEIRPYFLPCRFELNSIHEVSTSLSASSILALYYLSSSSLCAQTAQPSFISALFPSRDLRLSSRLVIRSPCSSTMTNSRLAMR